MSDKNKSPVGQPEYQAWVAQVNKRIAEYNTRIRESNARDQQARRELERRIAEGNA